MIVPPQVNQKYEFTYPHIEALINIVRPTVLNYCLDQGFAFTDRTKTVTSLSEKIETGRFGAWSEIDDIYACTVIIPSLSYEESAILFLTEVFEKIDLKERGSTQKSADVFRFDNPRFIGTLKNLTNSNDPPQSIKFEIQIKTAFEHAWSIATHSLVYKSNEIDWKLLRIASQLKASVEQLDMIILGAKENSLNIIEHKWYETEVKKHLLSCIKTFLSNPNVPDEMKPKDLSRISDNLYNLFKPVVDKRPFEKAEKSLTSIFAEFNDSADKIGLKNFPRSISLTQFFIGVSFEKKFEINSDKYIPLITLELETIFPAVRVATKRFVFS